MKLFFNLESVIAILCLIGFIFEAKIYRLSKEIGKSYNSCFPGTLGEKECDQLTNERRKVGVKGI